MTKLVLALVAHRDVRSGEAGDCGVELYRSVVAVPRSVAKKYNLEVIKPLDESCTTKRKHSSCAGKGCEHCHDGWLGGMY